LDSALGHFLELRERLPDASLSPLYKFTLLKHLTSQNDMEKGRELASELLQEVDGNSSPVVLQDFAALAKKLSPSIAAKVIRLCLEHPEIPSEKKDMLKRELTGLNLEPA
jgi:hypothetical protein